VVLASPRSYCAGVERAIEVVERALDRFGSPVYVRRQIVHNRHVVEALEERGAVFVEELDAVPDGATVVFSAHGVAPAVRRAAGERGLRVVDATCPLVAKVHTEARRFAAKGYELVLIGHAGHDEVEGTLGENAGIRLVETAQDVARLELRPEDRVAYLTQTTLAVDEVEMIVGSLRERWPELAGPAADDVCYATQNRQDALRAVAGAVDLVVVVSSPNSSNGNRLAEVARRMGARAELVDDASEIDLRWLGDAGSVAVTAAASAPESVVRGVVDALGSLGRLELSEHPVTTEKIRFPLPLEVR
ncbi:MAG: 4-hydroxy-3-methylbut-2-enyl diphosphate reductase, partial [Acidimicrobiales bacterium]